MTDTHTLNAGLWFRRGRLVMVFSSLAAIMPLLRGKSTYPTCSDFPNHLSSRGKRMRYTTVQPIFHKLLHHCGIAPRSAAQLRCQHHRR